MGMFLCFCNNDSLVLNSDKTHIYFVTKRNIYANLNMCYNNNFVTSTSCTEFLGMSMNETLSWDKHIETLAKKIEHSLLPN
jgi:hypothetical protein